MIHTVQNHLNCFRNKTARKRGPEVHREAKQSYTDAHQNDPVNLEQQQQIVCTCHCSLDLLQFLNSCGLFLLNWEVFDTHEITNFADNP